VLTELLAHLVQRVGDAPQAFRRAPLLAVQTGRDLLPRLLGHVARLLLRLLQHRRYRLR